LRKKLSAVDRAIVETMITRERKEMRPAHLLIRGAYDNPGEVVQHGTPRALPPLAEDLPVNRLNPETFSASLRLSNSLFPRTLLGERKRQ